MQGTIVVDSVVGRGTRIEIQLPLPVATEAAVASMASGPQDPSSSASLPLRLSVLLVDDNSAVRSSQRRTLSGASRGWAFAEVATGEAALALLTEGRRFDLIVVDQFMGKAGGMRALWTAVSHAPTLRWARIIHLPTVPLDSASAARVLPGVLLGHETVQQMRVKGVGCQRSTIIGCSANNYDAGLRQSFLDAGAAACWPKPLPELAEIKLQLSGLCVRPGWDTCASPARPGRASRRQAGRQQATALVMSHAARRV